MTRSRTLSTVAVIVAPALTLAGGLLAMPKPPTFSEQTSGDTHLGSLVEDGLIGAGQLHHSIVASIDKDGVTYAGFGVDEHTPFEIGSVTKTMTGLLFQDAIERGELAADSALASCLPTLDGSPAGGIELADLAMHTSGLGRQLTDPGFTAALTAGVLLRQNPYPIDADEMIELTRAEEVGPGGTPDYSNLGTALLGQAVAACAGMDYPSLIRTRLFDPIGMTETRIPLTESELQADDTHGYNVQGIGVARWAIGGHAPAGGVRSTAADMALYAKALLDGTAPGASAMDPRMDTGGASIGYFWMQMDIDGVDVTLHNGETGGFFSFLMLDRATGRGGLVLNDTAVQTPDAALTALTKEAQR